MAGDDVEVGWEKIRAAAGDVDGVAQDLGRELQALQSEIATFVDGFGGDDLGMLMGGTHEVISQFTIDKLSELLEDLMSHSKALDGVSATYRDNEEGGRQMFDQLGDGVEAV
ncbi:WXG100 family type VII secretion target [Actinopolymorpha pittospori]|uniref:Uncharacterized protein YukE n=1 Tax=Actinopolymorpha pittospori TaxID=648752 RepID=A0A927MS53_9ACTN|nr:hypothetical protein [Actinopolymorpha pittospori]MBE1604238.1 uncharacterized protein YukE [Actinopolymorpha pittospori]